MTVLIMKIISLASPAFAAMSDWQDIGGGKARLIAVLDPASNKLSGALEVVLKAGWSTYWRYPGSSGIPPIFDFSKSQGFQAGNVLFPVPQLLKSGDARYAGYKKAVLFPFSAEPISDGKASLDLSVLMGVCEEVCIPAQASFAIKSDALFVSDPATRRKLTLAQIQLPKQKTANDLTLDLTTPSDNTLQITVSGTTFSKAPELFVEGPSDWYLTPARLINSTPDKAVFELDVSDVPEGSDVLNTPLRFTLANGATGFEFQN